MSASNRERKIPVLVDRLMDSCPGCGHGIVGHLIMECLDELEQSDNIIFPIGVRCFSDLGADLECGRPRRPHGRADAVTTDMKRVSPDVLIVSYQDDGDAYNVGTAETFNAAYRNENITIIAVNNANFGITGDQMSPTTMEGQKTSTSVYRRDCGITGYPLRLLEMVTREFPGAAYAARSTVTSSSRINQLEGYIEDGLQVQMNHEGYSVIEILPPRPVSQGLTSVKAMECTESELVPYYPLGEFKEREVR